MADDVIALSGTSGAAAAIHYSVPLPGSHTGRRILKLDLELTDKDFTAAAHTMGTDLVHELGLVPTTVGPHKYDKRKAATFFRRAMKNGGQPSPVGPLPPIVTTQKGAETPVPGRKAQKAGLEKQKR